MNSKLFTLAALGCVSACPFKDAQEAMNKPLFGLLEQGTTCPESDAVKLDQYQAMRLFMKNMYSGYLKGWYLSDSNIIPDTCFNEQIETTWKNFETFSDKVMDDLWSVSASDVKDLYDQSIDTVYDNLEECKVQKVMDDTKDWCLENPLKCFWMAGLGQRLYDDPFRLLGNAFDIFKLIRKDDSCFTDMGQMEEVYRFSADNGEIWADLYGFDYKWDESTPRAHVKESDFEKEIWKVSDVENPLELVFPGVAKTLNGLISMFKESNNEPSLDHCGCWANGRRNEPTCEGGSRPTIDTCLNGDGRCHWGPSEQHKCHKEMQDFIKGKEHLQMLY